MAYYIVDDQKIYLNSNKIKTPDQTLSNFTRRAFNNSNNKTYSYQVQHNQNRIHSQSQKCNCEFCFTLNCDCHSCNPRKYCKCSYCEPLANESYKLVIKKDFTPSEQIKYVNKRNNLEYFIKN